MTRMHLDAGELRWDEPMGRHVSWRAGGPARRLYHPRHREDFLQFLRNQRMGEELLVFGLGSNLLVRDGGIEATVVQLHGALKTVVQQEDGCWHVEAGVPAPKVARLVARAGYAQAEFLAGIPGTMGGALAMNAGCYGQEIWTFVRSVETVSVSGLVRQRQPQDYMVGYRSVRLKESQGQEWFVSATLCFPPGNAQQATEKIRNLLARRVREQPLGQPNAGSVFRNPPGDFAARLIDSTGLKGLRVGQAEVSRQHANFIVNLGQACAADIETLIREVQQRVEQHQGICLYPEVCIVGEESK